MLDSEAPLSLRLGEQLADSIRLGMLQVLDGHLLHQLVQPPARVLYRTLQAHRRQDDGTLPRELSIPLQTGERRPASPPTALRRFGAL